LAAELCDDKLNRIPLRRQPALHHFNQRGFELGWARSGFRRDPLHVGAVLP
jgi:hypothetical protein